MRNSVGLKFMIAFNAVLLIIIIGLSYLTMSKVNEYNENAERELESSIILLNQDKDMQKVRQFRTYITRNWDRIFDWRNHVENAPSDARGLGAMESNQRRITFRMKKRGMHWSKKWL